MYIGYANASINNRICNGANPWIKKATILRWCSPPIKINPKLIHPIRNAEISMKSHALLLRRPISVSGTVKEKRNREIIKQLTPDMISNRKKILSNMILY